LFYINSILFIGTKIFEEYQKIKTSINAANYSYKDPGSGKSFKEALYLARKELFYAHKKRTFKDTLRQKKNRLVKKDDEDDEQFEKRKNDFHEEACAKFESETIPFDDYWYPDYWLVFVYMAKPAGHKAAKVFYTKPINEISAEAAGKHIKGAAALSGRANRRLASQLAANLMIDPTSKNSSSITTSSDLKIAMVPSKHDINLLKLEKKKWKTNLFSKAYDQLKKIKRI
jgi:hypothetical protein